MSKYSRRKGTLAGVFLLSLFHFPSHGGGLSVSFSKDIKPVLKRKCAVCHLTGKEAGNLALHPRAAWKSLVEKSSGESDHLLVKSGEPDQSYLVMKLEGTHLDNGGSGAQMPFAAPPLAPETIDKIRNWIAEGARDN